MKYPKSMYTGLYTRPTFSKLRAILSLEGRYSRKMTQTNILEDIRRHIKKDLFSSHLTPKQQRKIN